MINRRDALRSIGLGAGLASLTLSPLSAAAKTGAEIEAEAEAALRRLIASQPAAKTLLPAARGVLVFPHITKGGLLVGGAIGDGVLKVGGKTKAFYQSTAVSYGLQIGLTSYGYVMMFMDNASLEWLDKSSGWEIGVGPTVTVADEGLAKRLTTTTAQEGVYVFFVDQNGYFAGLGVEGTKISRIQK